ncbi:MATE family efflux transporter [Haloimpatiens lingqiaonensis]|uniref:MATE family efflux transporter n=1 Tax=Haloimpatiens lingqiaonensis TaxID=1380675 RepID=UPI0010FE6697|nr:MATE family efflux transporter [Haloimpatiens lingqiaonensis]
MGDNKSCSKDSINIRELNGDNLARDTFKLALPAIMEMLMQTLLGFADMAMVGSLGAAAIAAVGLSDMPMMTAMSIFAAVSVGTTALVARAIGAKKIKEAGEVAKQSLIISVLMAIVFTALALLLAKNIIILMGAEEEVIPISTGYFKITSLGLPMMIITMIMSGVLRGSGDTKTPMYINGGCNILNIIGNFLLIYPTRSISFTLPLLGKEMNLMIPGAGLGVAGAGISTTISRIVGGCIVLYLVFNSRVLVKIQLKDGFKINLKIIKRIFNIGIPAAIEQFFMRFGQLLFARIVASLGTVIYASHRITLTAESLSFNAGFGFALAATTLVGQFLGAEKPDIAKKSGFMAVKMGAIFMSTVGIFFFLFPDAFLMLFTRDGEIIKNARWCLRIVAISQPFLAGVMGFAGGLRGAGDTRGVLIITVLGVWGVRLTLAYVLAIVLGYGLIGAWIAMTIDLLFRGTLLFFRFRSGKWQKLRV